MTSLTKCRFCVERNGGYRYVAGKLTGGMKTCGKCNGAITDAREAVLIRKYFENDLEKYTEYMQSVQKLIDDDKKQIELLTEYISNNPVEKSVRDN